MSEARIVAVTSAVVEDGDASITQEDTIVKDGKLITTAEQVGNVHDSWAMQVKAKGGGTSVISEWKLEPSVIDGEIANGSVHGFHIILTIGNGMGGTQEG